MNETLSKLLIKLEKLELEKSMIDDDIRDVHCELNHIKRQIEKDNSHLIGKIAKCIDSNGNIRDLHCTKVICKDDFTVKPLFEYKYKKIIVETYEWI